MFSEKQYLGGLPTAGKGSHTAEEKAHKGAQRAPGEGEGRLHFPEHMVDDHRLPEDEQDHQSHTRDQPAVVRVTENLEQVPKIPAPQHRQKRPPREYGQEQQIDQPFPASFHCHPSVCI